MRFYFLLSLLTILGLSNSCVKNNPDPSWIEVNKWTLEANAELTGLEGELSHNFSEAWLYVDDEIVGVFEVPFKIPILKSGSVNIKVYPAIKNNGISATKKVYPFMEKYEITATLVKNQVLSVNPITRYNKLTKFSIEDFEDAAVKIETDPNSSTTSTVESDPLILSDFNGGFYGQVILDNDQDTNWIAYTNFASIGGANLPRGVDVYLEIDYYNTNAFTTGLLAISPSSIKPNRNIQLNDQDPATVKWKKIYIDLKELISSSDPSAYFEHTFEALIDAEDATGLIIIDNIKVVHF